ncbi:MAG: hypothetical protein HFH73_13580 [Lachnospiraceae bacterium]|jgi:uncharacterized protein YcfJ|nr:hypothetical protein [Lachnospiraceae bacterium]
MKKAEGRGAIVGSILGAICTGIVIYFTGSPFSSVIGLAGYLMGSRIGKSIDERK